MGFVASAATGELLAQAIGSAEWSKRFPPLSVRGVNYFPAETPWSEYWPKTPADVFQRDMALAAELNCNAVRTFLQFDAHTDAAGLTTRRGEVSEPYLRKIDSLLAAAEENGVRLILCFELARWFPPIGPSRTEAWQQAMRCITTHFRGDQRILLWDLHNEPESRDWDEPLCDYLRAAIPLIEEIDPTHPSTVGIGWQIERLVPLGLPDVLQYHEYSPKGMLWERGVDRVAETIATQRRLGGDRPLLIGEFGMSTARDPVHGAGPAWQDRLPEPPGTEADQRRTYRIILDAAERHAVAGVLPWCLHSYPTQEEGFLTPTESMFGLIRHNGTLKPAADLLRDRYAAWARR